MDTWEDLDLLTARAILLATLIDIYAIQIVDQLAAVIYAAENRSEDMLQVCGDGMPLVRRDTLVNFVANLFTNQLLEEYEKRSHSEGVRIDRIASANIENRVVKTGTRITRNLSCLTIGELVLLYDMDYQRGKRLVSEADYSYIDPEDVAVRDYWRDIRLIGSHLKRYGASTTAAPRETPIPPYVARKPYYALPRQETPAEPNPYARIPDTPPPIRYRRRHKGSRQ